MILWDAVGQEASVRSKDQPIVHVLHILDHSLPLQSGYVYRTMGILAAQRGFGWSTAQLTTPRQAAALNAHEQCDGWQFHRTPAPQGWLAHRPGLVYLAEMGATQRRIATLLAEEKPDIVHAHSPVLNGIPAYRVARQAGIPFVYEVRAFWEDAAVDLGTAMQDGPRFRLTRAVETWVLKRADTVVTLCEGMRDEIVARGVPEERVFVVGNAVNDSLVRDRGAPDSGLKTSLRLPGGRILGFLGSFYHYEGLDLLVQALPGVFSEHPDAALLLVGGGPEEEKLRKLVGRLGLEEKVIFAGRVPHGDIARYYDLIDIFVYPRRSMRLTELVTPLKPLEAMAMGGIVAASDVGGHRELLRDGETGTLFRSGSTEAIAEALLGLLSAPPERLDEMSVEAKSYLAAERTWRRTAEAYHPAYQRLLPNNESPV